MLRESLTAAATAPWRALERRRAGKARTPGWTEFWALRDVSFSLKYGDVLGIVGANGAGKSTLLKLLSRITEPTEGRITLKGRIASLLEVGTGFHPQLSGRENIFLNGAVLGMTRVEIARKFDEIVAFSEIEKFLDTPVKRYSSGMYMRLAFAVAAHLEPDILIVDEVLAVGDAQFQKKCLGKMSEVSKQGRTVLFVSHNMAAIAQLCERAIWLERGHLRALGDAPAIIAAYLESTSSGVSTWMNPTPPPRDAPVHIDSACVLSANREGSAVVDYDQAFVVAIDYTVFSPTSNLAVAYRLIDLQGATLWTSLDTDASATDDWVRPPGRYRSCCHIPSKLLKPGRYVLSIGAHLRRQRWLSLNHNALTFEVSPIGYDQHPARAGTLAPMLTWNVQSVDG